VRTPKASRNVFIGLSRFAQSAFGV
jgi:hypothetical protein